MQQQQQQVTDYQEITYESLSPLPENTNFAQLPQMLIPILTSNQWEQQLQALTFLRQLNKQYPSQVFNILQSFFLGLNSTLSGSPKVSKYAIHTLTEMLQNSQQCSPIGFGFSKFMEALLLKTLNEMKSLALLAQNLLSAIIQNQFSDTYDNYTMMFIELIYTNKNVNVAENAVKALAHLIASKGMAGLQSLQMENLGKLVQFVAKLTIAKRKVFQSYAAQIADYLLQLTGEQVFSNILTNFLQEEDQQNMIKAITSLKTKSNQGTQLSMQLRQHIREVKKSHIVNNNMKEVFGSSYEQKLMPLQQINMSNLQNMQSSYNQQQQQQEVQNQKNNNFNYSFGGNNNENNIFSQNQQFDMPFNPGFDKQQQFQGYQMQQNMAMNQFMSQ